MSGFPKHYYVRHRVYRNYAANNHGDVINVITRKLLKPATTRGGYNGINVHHNDETGEKKNKFICVHRFVWECFECVIPNGMQIDHINSIRNDNRLCNLDLVTPSKNNKRAKIGQDTSYCRYIKKNPKKVIATDTKGKEKIFPSIYSCSKELGIGHGLIHSCCKNDEVIGVKSGNSKINSKSYTFKFS